MSSQIDQEKKEKTQIINIRNERDVITTDTTDLKRVIRKYHEELYVNKFDRWDEINKSIERHKLLKLIQGYIDKFNSPIFIKEIEFVVKNLPTKKTPGPDDFTGTFYQIFKEEIMLIIHKLLQKMEEREYFSTNSIRLALPWY